MTKEDTAEKLDYLKINRILNNQIVIMQALAALAPNTSRGDIRYGFVIDLDRAIRKTLEYVEK